MEKEWECGIKLVDNKVKQIQIFIKILFYQWLVYIYNMFILVDKNLKVMYTGCKDG